MPHKQVSLPDFFSYCFEHQIPVAFYRLPAKKRIHVCAQTGSRIYPLNSRGNGFIFAPFTLTRKTPAVFIKGDINCLSTGLPEINFAKTQIRPTAKRYTCNVLPTRKSEYTLLVKSIKRKIITGELTKAVAARLSVEPQPHNFNVVSFFRKLCNAHPTAFVSLVYTPATGLWVGATPEVLLAGDKGVFVTYSLAGTKAGSSLTTSELWGKKEKEEQQIVTRYILKTFETISEKKPIVKGPETITAANLLHLRTKVTYNGIAAHRWREIVGKLHPTPAVAGLPKTRAIDFILRHEKNPREYYSGYLGPVTGDDKVNLFVNLRCMKVRETDLIIFTGCGITSGSKAENEWQETEIKKQTLLNVLKGY